MWLQVRRRYNAVLDENRKLKKDESNLLTSLKTKEERVKQLEEKDVEVLENKDDEALGIKDDKGLEDSGEKPKDIVKTQQSKCIETLDKAIQAHSVDADVSNFTMN